MKIKIDETQITIRELINCGQQFYVDGDKREIVFADEPEVWDLFVEIKGEKE